MGGMDRDRVCGSAAPEDPVRPFNLRARIRAARSLRTMRTSPSSWKATRSWSLTPTSSGTRSTKRTASTHRLRRRDDRHHHQHVVPGVRPIVVFSLDEATSPALRRAGRSHRAPSEVPAPAGTRSVESSARRRRLGVGARRWGRIALLPDRRRDQSSRRDPARPTRPFMTAGFVVFGVGVPIYSVALRDALPGWSWLTAAATGWPRSGSRRTPRPIARRRPAARGICRRGVQSPWRSHHCSPPARCAEPAAPPWPACRSRSGRPPGSRCWPRPRAISTGCSSVWGSRSSTSGSFITALEILRGPADLSTFRRSPREAVGVTNSASALVTASTQLLEEGRGAGTGR